MHTSRNWLGYACFVSTLTTKQLRTKGRNCVLTIQSARAFNQPVGAGQCGPGFSKASQLDRGEATVVTDTNSSERTAIVGQESGSGETANDIGVKEVADTASVDNITDETKNLNGREWNTLEELSTLLLKEEMSMRRVRGEKFPVDLLWQDDIVMKHAWERLCCAKDFAERTAVLPILYKKYKSKMERRKNAPINLQIKEENIMRARDEQTKNGFLRHFPIATLNRYRKNELLFAEQHGPHIVLDMSFQDLMRDRDVRSLLDQIEMGFSYNRLTRNPFHLHFTDVKPSSTVGKMVAGSFMAEAMGITITEQPFESLYDKDSLVYLTPDAREQLYQFNAKDVYVIGGLVDMTGRPRETYSKAKELGIRMAKFPLRQFSAISSRSLCLDHVIAMLKDLYDTQDWNVSIKHLPARMVEHGFYDQRGKR